MKIVIRAGGVGSRLWPVSRANKAKQFHPLTSTKTMLQDAVERVLPIVDVADIFISTSALSSELITEQCPNILQNNIIIEPDRKDTAAAIGLESIIIYKQDPDAIIASLGSDHSVRRPEEFQHVLKIAEECINRYPEYIIPIGIRPIQPDSGYGYIECGEVLDTIEGKNLWKVDRFTEKPSKEQARSFLEQGNFLWNANMFVWKVSTILELYKQHLPEMYSKLLIIQEALGTPRQQEVIDEIYPQLEQIAIDYAIIEKTDKIAVIAANIGWNDIGDWARLKDEMAESEQANVILGCESLSIETYNTLVYSAKNNKMVVTIGVEDLIIVDTEDALLICNKYDSAQIKKVVETFKEQKKDHLL